MEKLEQKEEYSETVSKKEDNSTQKPLIYEFKWPQGLQSKKIPQGIPTTS